MDTYIYLYHCLCPQTWSCAVASPPTLNGYFWPPDLPLLNNVPLHTHVPTNPPTNSPDPTNQPPTPLHCIVIAACV